MNHGWVLTVQNIEKLDKQLHPNPLADVKPLGKAQIEIDEGRCGRGVPPGGKIDAVEITVAVRVPIQLVESAEMKAALCPEDAAYLKFPRKIHQPVYLKNVVQRQIGRPLVKVGAIYECSRLCHEIAVAGRK